AAGGSARGRVFFLASPGLPDIPLEEADMRARTCLVLVALLALGAGEKRAARGLHRAGQGIRPVLGPPQGAGGGPERGAGGGGGSVSDRRLRSLPPPARLPRGTLARRLRTPQRGGAGRGVNRGKGGTRGHSFFPGRNDLLGYLGTGGKGTGFSLMRFLR